MKIKEKLLQMYGDEPEAFKEIVQHGCVSGCAGGLIYYQETCAFYDEFSEEIWDLAYMQSQEFGFTKVLSFIAELYGAFDVGSEDQFKNLLTWFAVEHVCALILSEKEGTND